MRDQAMAWVIGRYADRNSVTDDDSDFKFFHFSGDASGDGHPIFEENNVVSAAGDVGNFSFKLD